MRRALDLLAIAFINLSILWCAIVASTVIISSSPSIYREVLEEAEVYSATSENGNTRYKIIRYIGGDVNKSALFTDGQIDLIVDHIVDFLYTDMESFELTLDGVYNLDTEKYEDGVIIFGSQAVEHMAFVKDLLRAARISLIPIGILLIALIIIMIKKADAKKVLKYTGVTYAIIAAFAAIFSAWAYLTRGPGETFFYSLWGKMHYLIFPYSNDAFQSSFLLDTLVSILTTEFFLGVILRIVAVLLTTVLIWIAFLVLWAKNQKKE